ncbi:hypothetical protein AgCh_013165 [Apium graveolens]
MKEEFEMTDLGLMKYFLGIQVKQSSGEITLCQERYIDDFLKKFHMENCKPMDTPMAANQKLQLDDGATKVDMSYDTSWITKRIIPGGYGFTEEFSKGVKNFLPFAKQNSKEPDDPELLIRCPCNTCNNQLFQLILDVEFHLYAVGFLETYTIWHYHKKEYGSRHEEINDREDVFDEFEMLRDVFRGEDIGDGNNIHEEPNELASKFLYNVNNVGEPIYPGNTKYTQLKFITRLLHWRNRNKYSDKGFDELLLLLKDVFPEGHKLPFNYYGVKKMVKKLSLGFEKIHACENDCMLFYGDDKDLENCKYCELSRYKDTTNGGSDTIPRKILRYFKITPRLQRLYMSSHTAQHMKYHKNRIVTEGVLSHPADGEEWKEFDKNYPYFAADIRNKKPDSYEKLVNVNGS